MFHCGGTDNGGNRLDDCFALDLSSNAWYQWTADALFEPKSNMGASMHPTRGLVLTGGFKGSLSPASDVLETTLDGRNFERYPRLPTTLGCHCQVGD